VNNRYFIRYGALAVIVAAALFLALQSMTDWAWYWRWLIAAGGAAFALYGIDKGAAKAGRARVPELLHHLVALAGGFGGALLGMGVFRHKSNFRAHPLFIPIIIVGIALWAFIIYRLR
jgi:uncharacterized membrane protein YsdA (DUF1294 family)